METYIVLLAASYLWYWLLKGPRIVAEYFFMRKICNLKIKIRNIKI